MMDTMTYCQGNSGHSWQEIYEGACYASEAVVHLLSKEGFASAEVGRVFQARGGFIWRLPRSKDCSSTDDNRLLGAVMSKLAQRGKPAPCSLMIERYILQKAQDAGLLTFEESISLQSGKIEFACTPLLKDLDLMLRICCLPELLVEDSEVDTLLQKYYALLGESDPQRAKLFFEKLMSVLPDKRLALFVVPRHFLGPEIWKGSIEYNEEMDFLIQIPNLKRSTLLRIAIQLGPGSNCSNIDNEWIVKRLGSMAQSYWESEIRKLADQISYAVPEEVLTAAKLFREMPLERRKALQELIALPIAEAQLTRSIAGMIYMGKTAKIAIGNPQNLDLQVVVEAVQETIDALSSLYGIPCSIELRLADDCIKPDLEYYFVPSKAESSGACIAPRPLCFCSSRRSIQHDAIPRPIDLSYSRANSTKALRFFLNNVFRIQEFQKDQDRLIEQMLSLQGAICLLKSGGGKTLAYQLTSILQPGTALAVVPTIYVATSQEYDLAEAGIHKIKVVAGPQKDQMRYPQDSMEWNEADIIILSADVFQHPGMKSQLEKNFLNPISFLVFEEAHAISEWSHGFQPEYLNAVHWVKDNFAVEKPCMVALTSSSSRLVLLDIRNELGLEDLDCIVESVSHGHKNLQYKIHKVDVKNRMPILISALKATMREYGWQGKGSKIPCGLIICAQEDDSEMGLISIFQSLGSYLDVPAGICSFEPPKKFLRLGGSRESWMKASCRALRQFKRRELPILVCSRDSAIELNRRDLRFILYAGMPASLDEFYRQNGRVGQDGMKSSCIVLSWNDSDLSGQEDNSNKLDGGAKNKGPLDEEFPGRVMEKRILVWAASRLLQSCSGYNIGDRISSEMLSSELQTLMKGDKKLSFESKRRLLEKALHRLLLLGTIDGWEWKKDSLKVTAGIYEASSILENYKNLVGRYELEGRDALYLPKVSPSNFRNAVARYGCRWIDYGYQKIKTRKEEDLAKMIQAVKSGPESLRNFRNNMLDFVDRSRIKAELSSDSEAWWRVLDDINGSDELLDLYLACQWKIRSEPDNHALELIAGFCALAFQNNGQENTDFVKGFNGLKETQKEAYLAEVGRLILSYAELLIPSKKDIILENIWQTDPSLEISRFCYEKAQFSSEIHYLSLFELADGILGAFKSEASSNERR